MGAVAVRAVGLDNLPPGVPDVAPLIAGPMRLHPRLHGPYLRHRIALNVWAHRQLPEPGAELPARMGWREWAAVAVIGRLRRVAAYRFFAWTLLPGDQVHDILRMLDGVVVRVPRPGQAEVVWAGAETLHRHPGALQGASGVQHWRQVEDLSWHAVWRESQPAVRLAPGWRYSRR